MYFDYDNFNLGYNLVFSGVLETSCNVYEVFSQLLVNYSNTKPILYWILVNCSNQVRPGHERSFGGSRYFIGYL
jgi:hypothetical protein